MATAEQLSDWQQSINTINKFARKLIINSTNNQIYYTQCGNVGDQWVSLAGYGPIVPTIRTIIDLNPNIANTLFLSWTTLVSISSNNTYNANTWILTNTSSNIQDYNFRNGTTNKVISYYQNPMSDTNVQAYNKEIVAFYLMNITASSRVYVSNLERETEAKSSYTLTINNDGSNIWLTNFQLEHYHTQLKI